MPPGDNLFPDHKTETSQTAHRGNGTDPSPASPLTMQGAAELITQSQQPILEQIREQGEALNQIASRLGQTNSTREPAPRGEPQEDFLTRFSADPEGAIRDIGADQFKTVVPLLSNLMNSATSAFVGIESTEIDREFGVGAWDKFFAKPMNQILDSYRSQNVAALSDRNTVTREVNGLKGQLLNDLVDFRTASREKQAQEAEGRDKELEERVAGKLRTNLSGGLRRIGGEEHEVTDDLKNYLAERAAAIGVKVEPKQWLKETSYGNTLESYLEHQKKIQKEAS